MILLILGILIFAGIHLIPTAMPEFRIRLINKLSLIMYKVVFALLSFGAFFLIIKGWKSATPQYFYMLPGIVRTLMPVLMLIAILLFVTSVYPTRLKRLVHHPQLTAVVLFAVAHLLVNGDSRSMVLFGGLGLWAILEMLLINRREGEWVKGKTVGWTMEIGGIIVALIVLVGIIHSHVYLSGIPLM